MTNHRFSTDKRNVQRLVATHQIEHAIDERIAAKIAQFAESGLAAQMTVAVGVASGTIQRTFAGDFNREHRNMPRENAPPRPRQVARGKASSLYCHIGA